MFAGQVRPAPIDDPDVYASLPSTEPLEWREVDPLPEPRFDSYTEAQIHGGVTAADIERVYAMGCDSDEQERIRRAADKLGVPFRSVPLSDDQPIIPNWDTLYRLTHSGYTPAHESLLHGDEHWRRVANNGLRLAAETPGADPRIVLLFALFHDAFRETDGHDPDHGLRAAAVVERLADELLPFDKTTLQYALAYHDNGNMCSEPTIGVCWDSDRLELPRVGITVDPAYLSTEAGRKLAGREPSRYSPYWPKLYLRGALRWHQNGRWSLATSLESARGIAAGRERETLKRLEVSGKAA